MKISGSMEFSKFKGGGGGEQLLDAGGGDCCAEFDAARIGLSIEGEEESF